MKIAVYPGSFDPLHKGHLRFMQYLVECGRFDAVYLIVSPQNPLKDPSKALNAHERYCAATQAVARHPELAAKVKVDDIELSMVPPHYTFRTLKALSGREPGNEFTLAIGADNLDAMRRWKDYGRILSEYGVIVYPREGVDVESVAENLRAENAAYRIDLIDAERVDVSSTQIREAEALGQDASAMRM